MERFRRRSRNVFPLRLLVKRLHTVRRRFFNPRQRALQDPNDYESHFLTLDAKAQRRVMLQAPPVITASELKRIQNWLAVQFHVVESLDQTQPEQDIAQESAS